MKRLVSGLLIGLVAIAAVQQKSAAADTADKRTFERENFEVDGRPAFIIAPRKDLPGSTPWVFYAPTLGSGLPGGAEHWMFHQFLDAGIAIAGVDVGESYGSPTGRAKYDALHKRLTDEYGFAQKACLLARSRGGLMLYCWAAEAPEKVNAIAGIYPVCNIASYPGLKRACGAYGMTEAELARDLAKHNPVDRLESLAKARVPIFHIHGDVDKVVPLQTNSAQVAARYKNSGGKMELTIAKGQGHNMWKGFFECQALVDFVIEHATGVKARVGAPENTRPPAGDADLRRWLENMVWHHRFGMAEIAAATGLSENKIAAALKKYDIRGETRPKRGKDAPLLMLPYPGGRHPRIGFLDGAVHPQRETKASVFLPWDDDSYVVLDVPEAIWWNQGNGRELLYLAHTHIATTWDKQKIKLAPLEWRLPDDGSLHVERALPNKVVFGVNLTPTREAVQMEMWLTNGSNEQLTGLSVQNCVMLKGAAEFSSQTNANKLHAEPYVACRNGKGDRWVITAWEPCQRAWSNSPCPCMHSDPQFADCPPGKTVRLRGWLSFYDGTDVKKEFARIEATGWRNQQATLPE